MQKFKSAKEVFEKLKNIDVDNPLCKYTQERCEALFPFIEKIQILKKKHNAVILAHSYVHPDIIYSVADFVGDSYELAKKAKETDCEKIIFVAVRFMAQTAKIVNPKKIVLDPNPNSKCSLADSITKEDVLLLKNKFPDHTFVCYINTTAAIKALCDVCVTSSNAYHIIANLPNKKIYFLPDALMGKNIVNEMKKNNLDKEIKYFSGCCHVHEEYEAEKIKAIRLMHPDTIVLAHPECKEEVVASSDIVGSTSQMMRYIKSQKDPKSKKFLLLTECGISARLQIEAPDCRIVGSCMLCEYMKSNSLENIIQTMENPKPSQIVSLDETLRQKAEKSLDAMFYYASKHIENTLS